jgi:catechol-2,3-dioxygenase
MKGAGRLLSHIALNVTSLEASARFYALALKPLGFARADSEPGRYVRISNGRDAVIVLAQTEPRNSATTYHRKRVGLSHFALTADSRHMVDLMEQHLASIGVALLGRGKCEIEYRGEYYTLAFEDPDRIMIEVVWHRPTYFAL